MRKTRASVFAIVLAGSLVVWPASTAKAACSRGTVIIINVAISSFIASIGAAIHAKRGERFHAESKGLRKRPKSANKVYHSRI